MKTSGKVILGIFLGVILGGVVFFLNSINPYSEATPNYYENCNFDFIIPKPWYIQIPELKKMNIIEDVTPYYVTGRKLSYNGKTLDIDLFLFEPDSNIDITAFGTSLIKDGDSKLSGENIILDERAATNLGVKEGDKVSVTFGDKILKLDVTGIVYQNKFSTRPTAATLFMGHIKSEIEKSVEQLAYSSAYVSAVNLSEAENYFNNKYVAMGKVGKRSWYENDDSYEYMKKSIQNTSVAKEITNVSQLKANSTSDYTEATNREILNVLISVIIILVLTIAVWLFNISLSSQTFRNDIRLGTKVSSVINKFVAGEFITVLIFIVFIIFLKKLYSPIQFYSFIVTGVISFIIIFIVTRKKINRVYELIKKEKKNREKVSD